MGKGPSYRFTFRPAPSAVPAAVRLRHLLKFAWRALGLRCTDMEELPAAAPPPQDAAKNGKAGREPSGQKIEAQRGSLAAPGHSGTDADDRQPHA